MSNKRKLEEMQDKLERAKTLKEQLDQQKEEASDAGVMSTNFNTILHDLGAWDKVETCENCLTFMCKKSFDTDCCPKCENYFCDTCMPLHKEFSEILGGCD